MMIEFDLFPEIHIFGLKPVGELLDLRKQLGVPDCGGCLMGKRGEPVPFLIRQGASSKHRDDAEHVPAKDEGVPGKGVEPMVFHPLLVRESIVAEHIVGLHRTEPLGDLADLQRPQGDTAVFPIEV